MNNTQMKIDDIPLKPEYINSSLEELFVNLDTKNQDHDTVTNSSLDRQMKIDDIPLKPEYIVATTWILEPYVVNLKNPDNTVTN